MSTMVLIGRLFLGLAFVALLAAQASAFTGGVLLGLSQAHLYGDATVLALLGIGALMDAYWHGRTERRAPLSAV